ncbi:MAG: HlyC/CorC family transporter [Planctomycetes bacterium]|jgi:putative hemolysin|nr:HlyC/CorC family transporter [Planctomycetota bacterium]
MGDDLTELTNTVKVLYWVVPICAILGSFFALAAISLRSFRRGQLEDAFEGKPARRLEQLDMHLQDLRLLASFCRSMCNLLLVVFMLFLLGAGDFGWADVGWALAISGAIIAVMQVAIPAAWASHSGEKILAAITPILLVVRYLLYPIVAAMASFEVPVRRLSGVPDAPVSNGESLKQEIIQAVEEGQAEGAVEPEEVEMIESVMEFGDTRCGEIMTPRTDIFAISADTPWQQAGHRISVAGHSRVPIYEGTLDNIIGILYAKDLLQHVGRNENVDLRAMLRKPFFVPQTKPLDDLLREFKARKVHIAVVLDEYGGTAGLVSIEDVLEEIVGDIADEYDRPEPALMRRLDENSAEVDGRMYIDDLNDAMNLGIPEEEDYDTVAGFVFSELGYIPGIGESLTSHGAKFDVLDANERKINLLRVQRLVEERSAPNGK